MLSQVFRVFINISFKPESSRHHDMIDLDLVVGFDVVFKHCKTIFFKKTKKLEQRINWFTKIFNTADIKRKMGHFTRIKFSIHNRTNMIWLWDCN